MSIYRPYFKKILFYNFNVFVAADALRKFIQTNGVNKTLTQLRSKIQGMQKKQQQKLKRNLNKITKA